jgi:hypothetical protein
MISRKAVLPMQRSQHLSAAVARAALRALDCYLTLLQKMRCCVFEALTLCPRNLCSMAINLEDLGNIEEATDSQRILAPHS